MGIEFIETAAMSPKKRSRSIERKIAALAQRQHGVVTLTQLVALGLSRRAVSDRVAAGRLHRIHRGIFAVGHPRLTREGRWMAAVLAGGDGAALSHRAAGSHHGLRAWSGTPEVTVPRRRRSTAAIRFHTAALPADEIAVFEGIATTTVPRTIFDLAAILDRHGLEQAIREAEVRRLTDRLSLPDLLERHPGRRGTANLRAVLDDLAVGSGITREELEDRFARFIADERLPPPQRNAAIDLGDRVVIPDCLWRDQRLIVELDGHGVHARPIQIDSDKERDRDLILAGWRVVRVTWRHLHQGRAKLAADLRRLLGEVGDAAVRP